jgi:HD-like signal output (HDOD) protein
MELSALAIRVARTPGLGMLPQVTSQVLRLVDNPNASPRQIGALIERDAGLASKLLKSANSAYYGAPGKIKTVSQAISVMGLSAVRSIVVGQAYQQMTSVRGASKRFDRLAFWQHSLATASAARVLAKLKGWRDPEEAFLAGLLHDAGRLVMDKFLPNEFDQILTLALERVIPLFDAEREVLGYTHVEVGDLLGAEWNLPESMRDRCAATTTMLATTSARWGASSTRRMCWRIRRGSRWARPCCTSCPRPSSSRWASPTRSTRA